MQIHKSCILVIISSFLLLIIVCDAKLPPKKSCNLLLVINKTIPLMINEYENLLRDIIIYHLGLDSSNYKISSDRIIKWESKKEIDLKRKIGIVEDRIIYYSDFYDLKTIILKNWDIFLQTFLDKRRFEIFFDEVEKYRNTIAHGRPLMKSQLLLLEGILQDQKNLSAIYHNKNEMKDDYFIRITKVSDNLGNTWTDNLDLNYPVLRVGDEYEILIEAVDPKGREIEFGVYSNDILDIVQKENRFSFTITEGFIDYHRTILVSANTPSSEYKNKALFTYSITVLPK